MRHLLPCPPCGRQGRPGKGFLAGSSTSEPRGSAPRERDHRGGDHPVPSRTRQLSPPSPRVLQRKAAGGQGVALAEGAFLHARARRGGVAAPEARIACAGRGPQGDVPLRASLRFGPGPRVAALDAVGRRPGRRSRRRATGETRPARGFVSRVLFGIEASFRSACCHGIFSSAVLVAYCLSISLEFSFSRVVGHRFGGFDTAY